MSTTLLPDRPTRTRWDAQRVQAAVTGVLVCVLTGCTIGLGAGLATDSLVTFVLEAVKGP